MKGVVQDDLSCWARNGSWKYMADMEIVDNITKYAPCKIEFYGSKNPCSWVLDGKSLKYEWVPEHCSEPFTRFNASDFCTIMDGASILVVGDSVSHHSYLSWSNKLLSSLEQGCPPKEGETKCTPYLARFNYCVQRVQIPTCRGLSLISARNDRLSLTETILEDRATNFVEAPWAHLLDKYRVSVVIMNRGAHYENDTKTLVDLNSTLHFLSHNFPNVSLVWRNTPHGHTDYKSYAGLDAKPLSEPPKLSENHAFSYGKFQGQNEVVRKFLSEHYPSVLYLDVFTASVLRADNHYDALHICIPGVADTWLQLLSNAFRLFARRAESF
jgi:hypothetical protein